MTAEQFEMLIRIAERQEGMYDLLSNHLHEHFLYNIALFTAVCGLAGVIIKLLLNKKELSSPTITPDHLAHKGISI